MDREEAGSEEFVKHAARQGKSHVRTRDSTLSRGIALTSTHLPAAVVRINTG